MDKHQRLVRNPKTGLWEIPEIPEHRSSNSLSPNSNGVQKMSSHFAAESSLERQKLAQICAERQRLAEQAEREAKYRSQVESERLEAERKARISRQNEEANAKKQRENDLAKAMKQSSQMHRGYLA
ncbi:TPA: hypothetical protein RQK24_003776 [Vibrio vulnificus]|nr:hypothetical protein [Vibrio vulnificus]